MVAWVWNVKTCVQLLCENAQVGEGASYGRTLHRYLGACKRHIRIVGTTLHLGKKRLCLSHATQRLNEGKIA